MEFLNTLHILSTNLLTNIGALLATVLFLMLHRIFFCFIRPILLYDCEDYLVLC